MQIMKFSELALGARFSYLNKDRIPMPQIWIKLSNANCGLVAEYHPYYIKDKNWVGQRICSFGNTKEDKKLLDIYLREDDE